MSPAKPTLLRRAGARFIDALILAGLGYGWGTLVHFNITWLIVHGLLTYLYFVVADALLGRTAGKAVLGLRVVAADGVSRPTFRQSLLREAFVIVGAVPFVGPIVALGCWVAIAMAARRDEHGRGFHDNWAGGTFVKS